MTHRLLTFDEELALGHRIQAGDKDALDELVYHNQRLVYKLARQAFTPDLAMEFDDLVQIGMLGLLTAARRYDPARGVRFSTYATWWIKQHVQRAALTSGAIPRSANPNYQHERATSARIQAIRQAPIARLDAPLRDRRGDDSDNTLGDLIASAGPSVEAQVTSSIDTERLIADLRLNPRGEAIIRDWLSGVSRDEVQRMHGVSHSWIHSMLSSRKERLMSQNGHTPKTCNEPGCGLPKWVDDAGRKHARCETHQKRFWAEATAARTKAKRAAAHGLEAEATRPPKASPVRPLPPEATPAPEAMVEAAPSIEQIAVDHVCRDDCNTCVYRQALDLVAERYPDVAELVDAMQTLSRWRKA